MYRYCKKLIILVIFHYGNLKNCLTESIYPPYTSDNKSYFGKKHKGEIQWKLFKT